MDCVSCGSCSWLCPSHIPLVHYFNYAKGMINDQERERRKNEQTRILAEAHTLRVEKAAADKAAALAAKKAQAAAAAAAKQKDEDPRMSFDPIEHSAPFTHQASSVQKIMFTVLLALMPATAFNLYLFGWPAILLFTVTIGACVAVEAGCLALGGQPVRATLGDYSAVLTGWLLAMSLPPWAPWWIGVLGAIFAIALAKHPLAASARMSSTPPWWRGSPCWCRFLWR